MEKAGDYVAVIAQAIFNSAMRLAKSLTPKSIKAKHPSHATVQPEDRDHFPNFGLVATVLAVRPAQGQEDPRSNSQQVTVHLPMAITGF
tara:strand:- start:146 stop:412 length:267 start_codon:yes stop_codon:yes gene_type:complete